MPSKEFRVEEGSEQQKFLTCRNDIALMTGGFGNGKTSGLAVTALSVVSTYENARALIGRATRPKLEDSTKPEMLKWLPKEWVKSWPNERKNNVTLHNGSTIEFRHIRQEGKGKGEEQSNLLSATYDFIGVDQIDDPEFTYKDFADLIGRLRGTAKYTGDDATMPRVGPQWFRATANPTRNWLFRELVNPYFIYQRSGIITQKLLYDQNAKRCMIDVFNAPSSANVRHTGEAYIGRMAIVFRGSMAKRYIQGAWDAYEGLVYPDYDSAVHLLQPAPLQEYIAHKLIKGDLGVVEGYDYGQASPSCYLLAFVDSDGNLFVVDGFYRANYLLKDQAEAIKEIRARWKIIPRDPIYADPDIFRRKQGSVGVVASSVAQMFEDLGISMQRGNNDIDSGIQKFSSYLQVDGLHRHPITRNYGSPRVFFSADLEFVDNEISDFYWNKNTLGQNVDKPRDVNDHAMDTMRYILTGRPKVVGMLATTFRRMNPAIFGWHEVNEVRSELLPRHM